MIAPCQQAHILNVSICHESCEVILPKGSLLSVNNCLVGPYCEICCWNFACMASVVLEEALNKG